MRAHIRHAPLALCLFVVASGAQDIAGSGDHPLVPRYPGAEICATESQQFDTYELVNGPAKSRESIPTDRLEGQITRNMYVIKEEGRSSLEVMRNYEIALREAGFTEIYSCHDDDCAEGPAHRTFFFFRSNPNLYLTCKVPDAANWGMPDREPRYFAARLVRPTEGDVHAAISIAKWSLRGGSGPSYVFVQADVIEAKPMQVGMELKLAAEMDLDINTTGRAVLYGIQFDTDSTEITPRSEQTLDEIAKLLAERPKLNILVVGHTDNQGTLEYNLDLSARRAAAVVETLQSSYGIDSTRLDDHGVGFLAPISTNRTADGRALNRRVELVEN